MGKLTEIFSEFKEIKNIDKITMMKVVQDVFRNAIKKKYGTDENFDVIINVDKGDLEILRNRVVVKDEDFEDPIEEIKLSEAKEIDDDYEEGEEFTDEIKFEELSSRRLILSLKQNLSSKISDIEKNNTSEKYKEKVGQIISGEIYQVNKREAIILDDEGIELIMPYNEQIRTDNFRKGDMIRAVVYKVDMRENNPIITLSRTRPEFLERLFENEVPEIFDGLITIKRIVRIPGEKAKVAVESYDDRIDPVGACVGIKGARIHGIVRELRNENIDIINYTNNTKLFITRALSPAKVVSISLDEENKKAEVHLKLDQVSLAIGKGGLNIKLASQITGYTIDVFREIEDGEEDVNIEEFGDEIEEWVIDELKSIGCDTAKSVLMLTEEELVKRTELEEETVKKIIKIFKSEFE